MRIRPPRILTRIRNPLRNLLAIHIRDKPIRSINTSRNARTRVNVAILDPPRHRHVVDVRAERGSPFPRFLVGGGFLAVEDAGARDDGAAGADGDQVLEGGVDGFYEGDFRVDGAAGTAAAGDEEDIDWGRWATGAVPGRGEVGGR